MNPPRINSPHTSQASPPRQEIFLNEHDLAKRWQLHVKTIQKWRLDGSGPRYTKLCSAVRYALSDVALFEQVAKRDQT